MTQTRTNNNNNNNNKEQRTNNKEQRTRSITRAANTGQQTEQEQITKNQ